VEDRGCGGGPGGDGDGGGTGDEDEWAQESDASGIPELSFVGV